MPSSIALSRGTQAALLTLQTSAAQSAAASARLASGLKVERPVDGPEAYFTAQNLNARAGALSNVLDGMSRAQGALEAADTASKRAGQVLEQIEALMARTRDKVDVRPTVRSVVELAGGVTGATDLDTLSPQNLNSVSRGRIVLDVGGEAGGVMFSYGVAGTPKSGDANGVADGTTVQEFVDHVNAAGRDLIARVENGSLLLETSDDNFILGHGLTWRAFEPLFNAGTFSAYRWPGVDRHRELMTSRVFTSIDQNMVGINGAFNMRFADEDGVTTPNIQTGNGRAGATPRGFIDAINAMPDFSWTADFHEGRIRLSSDRPTNELRLAGHGVARRRIGFTTQNYGSSGAPALSRTLIKNDIEDEYEQYRELRGQLDTLVRDASFQGTNLALGDRLDVSLNERGATLALEPGRIDAASLGLPDVEKRDFVSSAGFLSVDAAVEGARDRLEAFTARLPSSQAVLTIRASFNEDMINILRAGADGLVLADTNAEGARLLASDVRSQLALQALRLSTQADQGVLALFR